MKIYMPTRCMKLEDTNFVSQRKRVLGPSDRKKVHSHGCESMVNPQSVELLNYFQILCEVS